MRECWGLILLLVPWLLLGAERGSPAEARALLAKAVAHAQAVGLEQAKRNFVDPQGGFIDRDLYIYCMGPDNRLSAHAVIPALVGFDLGTIRDADGKMFGKIMADETRAKGSTEVRYKWTHPQTRKIEPKIAFTQMIGNEFCAVGAYLSGQAAEAP